MKFTLSEVSPSNVVFWMALDIFGTFFGSANGLCTLKSEKNYGSRRIPLQLSVNVMI